MRIRGTLNLEILDVKDLSVNAVAFEVDSALRYALESFNENAGPLVKHWSIAVEQINPVTLDEGNNDHPACVDDVIVVVSGDAEVTIDEEIQRG